MQPSRPRSEKKPKGGIAYLETSQPVHVLGSNADGSELHLDTSNPIQIPATLHVEEGVLNLIGQDGPVTTVEGDWLISDGTAVELVRLSRTNLAAT